MHWSQVSIREKFIGVFIRKLIKRVGKSVSDLESQGKVDYLVRKFHSDELVFQETKLGLSDRIDDSVSTCRLIISFMTI